MDKTVVYHETETAQSALVYVLGSNGNILEYPVQSYARIGRDTPKSTADIKLASSIVSRNHGELVKQPDGYIYRDNGSLNGTFINGELYGKGNAPACRLRDGDVLRIDQSNLQQYHPESVVMLFMLNGAQKRTFKTQMFTETTGNILIGRDVKGKDGLRMRSDKISRKHATFRRGVNGWSVVDHNSTNGVYVNNRRIDQPVALHSLDVVRIANTMFIFFPDRLLYTEEETAKGRLAIHIEERAVRRLFKKHVLLQDIDLSIDPGEMVLILGGSGAGKTTFFNAVMGYERASGQILHDGVDIYKEYDLMKYKIGFVPQQDLIREDDSVFSTLDNAASMKMPAKTTTAEKRARINEVLELLGLQRERNSLVKKLSGGQKKKLSIAIEFISDPSLFFLDEPDSGLDGVMASSLMKNLRVIADEGKIVMVITHAPDRVSSLFDKVIVLAKSSVTNSGHLAFFGPIAECLDFFDAENLEGVVRRINRPDEGGDGRSDYYIEKFKVLRKEGVSGGDVKR